MSSVLTPTWTSWLPIRRQLAPPLSSPSSFRQPSRKAAEISAESPLACGSRYLIGTGSSVYYVVTALHQIPPASCTLTISFPGRRVAERASKIFGRCAAHAISDEVTDMMIRFCEASNCKCLWLANLTFSRGWALITCSK